MTRLDGLQFCQWRHQGTSQRPAAHGRARAVQDVHEGGAIRMIGMQDFEVAHREAVQPHSFVWPKPADSLEVIQLAMVRGVQVVQHYTHGHGGERGVVQPKSLQGPCAKLLFDQVVGVGFGEHPIVELGARHVVPKQSAHVSFTLAVDEPFLGLQASKDAVDPTRVSFGGLEFAGAQVEQGQPHGFRRPMNCSHVVVGFAFEYVVVHHQARGDEFRHAAFDKAFGLFGVLKLVADGHFQAGLDELGQVGVQAVMREACEFHLRGAAVSALGQHDVQHFGGRHGICPEGLVKVPDPEEQHGVRMLDLDPVVLLHQRGLLASHVEGF